MSKISVVKGMSLKRPYNIIHQYRPNQVVVAKAINQPRRQLNTTPKIIVPTKTINNNHPYKHNRTQVCVQKTNFTRSSISKFSLPTNRQKHTNSNFDSQLSKINTLKGMGKGKILAMFAPGPSILEAEIEKLKGIDKIDTISINKPDMRVWETSYWMFCDRTQHTRNKSLFDSYNGTLINAESIKSEKIKQIRIKSIHGNGFSFDLTRGFYIGRSTTYSAMQVAAWMEYDKIFIFGCDMCRVGGKLHSYGVNPDVPEKIRESRFEKEAEFYMSASKIMSEDLRKKFYFCSSYNPWPFIDRYNRLNQKEAVDFILNANYKIMDNKSKEDSQ